MPHYVYETVDTGDGKPLQRYELWQSMKDDPYTVHPETGEAIRRILIGGIGMPGSISDRKADSK